MVFSRQSSRRIIPRTYKASGPSNSVYLPLTFEPILVSWSYDGFTK